MALGRKKKEPNLKWGATIIPDEEMRTGLLYQIFG